MQQPRHREPTDWREGRRLRAWELHQLLSGLTGMGSSVRLCSGHETTAVHPE